MLWVGGRASQTKYEKAGQRKIFVMLVGFALLPPVLYYCMSWVGGRASQTKYEKAGGRKIFVMLGFLTRYEMT